MSSRPTNPMLASARQQQQNLQSRAERPVQCPKCGSTWFREGEFRQYSAMLFGSGAGADLRVIGNTMQTIRICLCGFPITPNISGVRGKTATAEGKDFAVSLKGAQDALMANAGGGNADLEAILDQVPTKKEFQAEVDAVKLDVGGLRSHLNQIQQGLKTTLQSITTRIAELAHPAEPAAPETVTGDADDKPFVAPPDSKPAATPKGKAGRR